MSVPVAFSDIGKPTKDLLAKDYPVGSVALEVKTTAANGLVCHLVVGIYGFFCYWLDGYCFLLGIEGVMFGIPMTSDGVRTPYRFRHFWIPLLFLIDISVTHGALTSNNNPVSLENPDGMTRISEPDESVT